VKKRLMFGAVALAAVGIVAAFATSAYANPDKTKSCDGCHSGAVLAVTATQTTNDGVTASYTLSAPGADAIAVFDGATKLTTITGAAGTVSVPVGKAYVIQAVAGPKKTDGWGSKNINPVTPVVVIPTPDTTPVVVPTSDTTPVVVPTPDTTPVVTPDTTGTASVRIHVMAAHGHGVEGMTVTLTNTLTGTAVTGVTDDHGMIKFSGLTKGTYTASVTLTDGTVLTKTFKVGDHNHRTVALKDHKAKTDHKHATHKASNHKSSDHKSTKAAKTHTTSHVSAARH